MNTTPAEVEALIARLNKAREQCGLKTEDLNDWLDGIKSGRRSIYNLMGMVDEREFLANEETRR